MFRGGKGEMGASKAQGRAGRAAWLLTFDGSSRQARAIDPAGRQAGRQAAGEGGARRQKGRPTACRGGRGSRPTDRLSQPAPPHGRTLGRPFPCPGPGLSCLGPALPPRLFFVPPPRESSRGGAHCALRRPHPRLGHPHAVTTELPQEGRSRLAKGGTRTHCTFSSSPLPFSRCPSARLAHLLHRQTSKQANTSSTSSTHPRCSCQSQLRKRGCRVHQTPTGRTSGQGSTASQRVVHARLEHRDGLGAGSRCAVSWTSLLKLDVDCPFPHASLPLSIRNLPLPRCAPFVPTSGRQPS